MKYIFPERIRYSEVDQNGRLTLHRLIDILQDCGTFHGEDNGVSIRYLKENHLAWVVASWQIIINELPMLGDRVNTGTWAYGYKGFIGLRNHDMVTPDGRVLVQANSEWVLMNTDKYHPARVSDYIRDGYGLYPEMKIEADFGGRKISIPEGGEEQEPITVMEYHLDTNHHVNNGQYVLMAQNYLPEDFRIRRFRAEYKKQAFLGDEIRPCVSETKGGFIICLNTPEGEPYFVSEMLEKE